MSFNGKPSPFKQAQQKALAASTATATAASTPGPYDSARHVALYPNGESIVQSFPTATAAASAGRYHQRSESGEGQQEPGAKRPFNAAFNSRNIQFNGTVKTKHVVHSLNCDGNTIIHDSAQCLQCQVPYIMLSCCPGRGLSEEKKAEYRKCLTFDQTHTFFSDGDNIPITYNGTSRSPAKESAWEAEFAKGEDMNVGPRSTYDTDHWFEQKWVHGQNGQRGHMESGDTCINCGVTKKELSYCKVFNVMYDLPTK